jgi:SAM-dependent methyltransferase
VSFDECLSCRSIIRTRIDGALTAADQYEAQYHQRKRNKRWTHRVKKAARQIRAALRFGTSDSVLDLGCSVGYVVSAAQSLKLRGAGVDVSTYAVAQCLEKGLTAKVGTLEKIPFASGEFGLVFMRHVLEHTATPRDALAEASRVLNDRGLLVIHVPDGRYWKGRLFRKTYRYFRPDDLGAQHAVYYVEDSLLKLLGQCGFEVVAPHKGTRPDRAILNRLAGLFWSIVAACGLRRELYVVARKR